MQPQQSHRVLMILEWYYPIGGIEAFVHRLAEKFTPGTEVILAVRYFGRTVPLSFHNPRVSVVKIPAQKRMAFLARLAREQQVDIIHSHHISTLGVAALFAGIWTRTPVIISNHRVPVYRTFTWRDWFYIPVTCLWYSFFNNLAQCLTTPTETVARLLRKIGIFRPIKVISCGVDTALYQPAPFQVVHPLKILYVGRFAADKNLDVLLDTFILLRKRVDVELTMIGSKETYMGNTWSHLEKKITAAGIEKYVHCPGHLAHDSKELIQHYQQSDVFVLTSYYETQSIVTLEAMACGLPVVASRSGALPELVQDGVSGYLFRPLDPTDLADKLAALLQDEPLRKKMAAAAREQALAHDITHSVQAFEALYQQLLK